MEARIQVCLEHETIHNSWALTSFFNPIFSNKDALKPQDASNWNYYKLLTEKGCLNVLAGSECRCERVFLYVLYPNVWGLLCPRAKWRLPPSLHQKNCQRKHSGELNHPAGECLSAPSHPDRLYTCLNMRERQTEFHIKPHDRRGANKSRVFYLYRSVNKVALKCK